MSKGIFAAILASYMVLLCATGYLAFFQFPGSYNLPSPEMIKTLGTDPDFKQDLLEDIKQARERDRKLIELSAQSFNVILGALLGFLSAVGAHKIGIRRSSDPARPDAQAAAEHAPPDSS